MLNQNLLLCWIQFARPNGFKHHTYAAPNKKIKLNCIQHGIRTTFETGLKAFIFNLRHWYFQSFLPNKSALWHADVHYANGCFSFHKYRKHLPTMIKFFRTAMVRQYDKLFASLSAILNQQHTHSYPQFFFELMMSFKEPKSSKCWTNNYSFMFTVRAVKNTPLVGNV